MLARTLHAFFGGKGGGASGYKERAANKGREEKKVVYRESYVGTPATDTGEYDGCLSSRTSGFVFVHR